MCQLWVAENITYRGEDGEDHAAPQLLVGLKNMSRLLRSRDKEHHEYLRHGLTVIATWFSFFVTFNYAAMGLIFNAADKLRGRQKELEYLSLMFEWQVFLGMVTCIIAIYYFFSIGRQMERD